MNAWLRRALSVQAQAGVLLIGACFAVQAQTAYPNQPIKVIVPFPPAGGTDTVARLLLDRIRSTSNWNFVVDNRPGAGGNIGMDAVAKSKPDGYTLGMGQTANLAINPSLYSKMPFDVAKDFVPIALIAGQAVVLVVNATSPFKTVADLVAAAKAKPSVVTMASAGNGTVGHLTGELFARQAGITINHIPYKGAGPAATDLLGGQVDFYFATPQTAIPFLKSGKLRALAVSSAKRMPALPDVPTVAESGFKGFDTTDWKVLVAPAGTPTDIVKRLNAEAEKAMSSPEAIARLLADGSVPMSGSPQQVAQYLKAEAQRWAAVVHAAGIKAD
jgi:tripartite-type tricarboxylate transporter receptor subunit TctC